ncbi:hypothetical protein [Methanolacinia paynteri]|uniref:hypothetical protein n=1 Tax=Methanolacinia paynteri TaxID=230356 RepID=UPI00064F4621|nr:hypothetical protein [Methanolacinia paynteri]
MKNKNRSIHYLLAIAVIMLIVSSLLVSGCTVNNSPAVAAGPDTTVPEQTDQQPEQVTDNYIGAGERLAEPVKVPGTWIGTDKSKAIPDYDDETKEKYLAEAKAEILRVFPETDVSTLNRYYWDAELAGSFFIPALVFSDVIVDKTEPENACDQIYYSPDKKRITWWYYDTNSPARGTSGSEIIRQEDVDMERDVLPVFKNIIGNEEFERNRDNYSTYLLDDGNIHQTTAAYICEGGSGVKCYMGNTRVSFSRTTGRVVAYRENFNEEEFYSQAVKLPTVPKISLEEAKSILEAKLDELYPDDPQNIQYPEGGSADLSGGLFWLDSCVYMDIEDDYLLSPVPLAWGIIYITKESQGWGGSGEIWAAVDANTGEIVSMYNDRIRISGKTYD